MDEIRKIPPVTRFMCLSTIGVTLPLILQLISPYVLVFQLPMVTKDFQLWRLFTTMFFGETGINFIFNVAMLYRNSEGLELTWYQARSADYAYRIILASLSLLAINIPLHSHFHFRPLLVCLVYLGSRLSPTQPVSLFGLVSFANIYFPFVLIGLDLLMGGPSAAVQSLTGAIIGHGWWLLEWKDSHSRPRPDVFGRTPGWLKWLVGDAPAPNATNASTGGRSFGTATVPRGRTAGEPTTGYRWGSGNRLGDS